jgi:hypothetical protein
MRVTARFCGSCVSLELHVIHVPSLRPSDFVYTKSRNYDHAGVLTGNIIQRVCQFAAIPPFPEEGNRELLDRCHLKAEE